MTNDEETTELDRMADEYEEKYAFRDPELFSGFDFKAGFMAAIEVAEVELDRTRTLGVHHAAECAGMGILISILRRKAGAKK